MASGTYPLKIRLPFSQKQSTSGAEGEERDWFWDGVEGHGVHISVGASADETCRGTGRVYGVEIAVEEGDGVEGPGCVKVDIGDVGERVADGHRADRVCGGVTHWDFEEEIVVEALATAQEDRAIARLKGDAGHREWCERGEGVARSDGVCAEVVKEERLILVAESPKAVAVPIEIGDLGEADGSDGDWAAGSGLKEVSAGVGEVEGASRGHSEALGGHSGGVEERLGLGGGVDVSDLLVGGEDFGDGRRGGEGRDGCEGKHGNKTHGLIKSRFRLFGGSNSLRAIALVPLVQEGQL